MSFEMIHGQSFNPLDTRLRSINIPVSTDIATLMDICVEEAEISLHEGGTPVGAVLFDMDTGERWRDHSTNPITGNIQDHAEIKTYRQAAPIVRDKLAKCALISTLELCNMCTTTFAQGDIGTIIAAAPRVAVVAEDGRPILRPRKYGMYEMLDDSGTHTNAYMGYRAAESVELWRTWDRKRRSDQR